MENKNTVNPELLPQKLVEEEDEFHHINNPATGLKPIVKKYLGAPTGAVQKGNKFFFTDGDAKVEVTVVTDEIIRVRLAPHSVFLDEFSYAVPKLENKVSLFGLREEEAEYIVYTNIVNCHVRKKDFFISFSDNQNHVTSADAVQMHWEENIKFGG